MIFYRNVQEIMFRLTNVIPERIIFVSWGITVSGGSINKKSEKELVYFKYTWKSRNNGVVTYVRIVLKHQGWP